MKYRSRKHSGNIAWRDSSDGSCKIARVKISRGYFHERTGRRRSYFVGKVDMLGCGILGHLVVDVASIYGLENAECDSPVRGGRHVAYSGHVRQSRVQLRCHLAEMSESMVGFVWKGTT